MFCLMFEQELDHPEFGHYAVKRALATAFDKHDREREMTSVLLSTLYNEVGWLLLTVCVCRRVGLLVWQRRVCISRCSAPVL